MQPDPVVVRAPLAAVRQLLQPRGLPAVVPGLVAEGGATTVLRLWRRGGVEQFEVALDSLPDGSGGLVRSVGASNPDFRLSLRAVADERRPMKPGALPRCRLAVDAEVSGDPPDASHRAAWLRHVLPLLAAEVAAAAEDVAMREQASYPPEGPAAEEVPSPADLPVTGGRTEKPAVGRPGPVVHSAVVAAAAAVGLVIVVVRRRASRGRRGRA